QQGRPGQASGSIVSDGCVLARGCHRNRVLGRNVHIHSGALVEDAVLLADCWIGRDVRIRRAILNEHVAMPDGTAIGYDVDQDRRQYHRTESGIVVVEGHAASEMWTR